MNWSINNFKFLWLFEYLNIWISVLSCTKADWKFNVAAPDKRDSNTNIVVPPAPPKRLAYKRNTEWSTDDDSEAQNEPNDLRDSGISTASLLDFQSHLTNLNNLGYEDFEPRARCNDIMNISPPCVINALNVSTGNFANVTFQGSHSLPGQEVIVSPSKILIVFYVSSLSTCL